jgi:hypothetical protein
MTTGSQQRTNQIWPPAAPGLKSSPTGVRKGEGRAANLFMTHSGTGRGEAARRRRRWWSSSGVALQLREEKRRAVLGAVEDGR